MVFDHTGKCEILRETFFGGAHIEGESFYEEFRDEVEQKVHDLKENHSKDGDEFLNRPITYEEVKAFYSRNHGMMGNCLTYGKVQM